MAVVSDIEIRLRADIARLQQDMNAARRSVDGAMGGITQAAQQARNALGGIAAGLGAGALASMVDQYVKFTSQLKLATQSQREYNTAYADVKRIAAGSTQGLQETGVLYARVANGVRELGVSQKQLGNIVEVVNLSLLVSGATASEAASAQLQLSQAFASGTLRGEEFNSVNEAAPRLMKALADGIGVPVGALKQMAGEGLITSEIMANVLPKALATLREEAKNIQTISGSFVLLKNNAIEFVGSTAQASGAVSAISGLMAALANNLHLVAGALLTVVAVRIANFLDAAIARTVAAVAANNALIASNLATAKAEFASANAADFLAGARLNEVRAATLASAGNVQLALTTNGLIPAQRAAAVTSLALSASYFGLQGAQAAATLGARALNAALAFTGGPLGLIITLLGAAATAWGYYEYSQTKANEKAAADTKASAGEITENLAKVNAMLRERIALQNTGASGAVTGEGVGSEELRDTLREINDLKAKGASLDASDQIRLISLQGIYSALNKEIEDNASLKQVTEANGSAAKNLVDVRERLNGVNGNYLKDLGLLKTALDKGAIGQAEYVELVSKLAKETYKASDAGKAGASSAKDAAKAAKEQAKEYGELISGLQLRVAATAREVEGLATLTKAEEEHIALTEKIRLGKIKLTSDQEKAARSLIDEAGANDVLAASRKKDEELQQLLVDNAKDLAQARYALIDSAKSEAEQNERLVATYGMSESAIIRYNSARLKEQEAKRLGRELNVEEIADLEKVIALRNRSAEALAKKDDLDRMFDTTQVQSFGDALRDAFSEAGTAMGKLGGALGGYVSKQIGAQKSIAQAKLKYADDDKRFALEVGRINARQEQERLGAYAEITGAAKGFFKEGTTGYNVLAGAEKAFRLAEIASQMQSLYTHLFVTTSKAAGTVSGQAVETAAVKAGETARNAAKIPGVFMSFMSALGPWGMAAAGVAIAAVLGGAFSGGKASTAVRAEDVQKAQGTGSVFGDSSAKSDSISRSLELIEKNSDMLLPLTQNMLGALRGIEAAMGGLANLVARTAGLTTGSGFGIETGQLNIGKPTDAISKVMTGITEGLLGPGLGGKVASFINNIWGKTKQEITDSGLQFGGSVASLQAGAGFQQYANVSTTKSSFFGLSKKTTDSLQTAALDADIAKQFGMVFTSLETVLRSAATGLGRDGDAVGEAVRNTIIDMTKLSLKGLSGDELADAINAVISKASDDVAMAALPGFDDFRKLGEGYTETIVRVASGIESAQYELERLGISAIAYADIANKQGDVGAEIVRQSILTVESLAGVRDIMSGLSGSASELAETYGQLRTAQDAMRMVNLDPGTLDVKLLRGAGGLDNLQSALEDYFDGFFSEAEQIAAQTDSLGRQFAALGLAMPATNDAFRSLVETTPALRGQLLLLAGGFADLMADTSRALDAAAEQAAAAAEKVAAALAKNEEALRAGVDAAFDAVGRAVAAQRDQVTAAYQAVTERITASITAITARVADLTRLSDALAGSLTSVESDTQSVASRGAARAQVQAAIAIAKASGVLPSVEQLQGALSTLKLDSSDQFSSLVEYQREVARTNAELQVLGGLTDKQLTDSQRQLAVLEDQKALAERQYNDEMARLDGILDKAQAQVDAINGVRTDVQSVGAAIAGLNVAIQALKQGATALSPTGGALTVEDLYRTVLGREGEAAGLEYWKKAFGDVVDSSEYAEFIKGAEYELGLKQPPIAYTAPSSGTMTTNADQQKINDNMAQQLSRIAANTEQFATQFNNVSAGGQALLVET